MKRILCSGRYRHPACQMRPGDDQPELAIVKRPRGVARRGFGPAIRVGMIMTDDTQAFTARLAVGGKQYGGIDLEPAARVGGNITGRADGQNMARLAQQQPADLFRHAFGSKRSQLVSKTTCNPDNH